MVDMSIRTITIQGDVTSLDQLRGADGRYLSGTVNVAGRVYLVGMKLERLPVQFDTVGGDFCCSNNRLTTLEGAPSTVGRYFDCSNNRLTTLEGAPSIVGKYFYCNNNLLTSLEGAPSAVSGYFGCHNNRLTSLVGAHRILRRVGGEFYLWSNPIESGGIGLLLVEGLTQIYAGLSPARAAFEIIGRHLGQGMKGVLRCQEALYEAGLGTFAQL